MKSEAWTKNDAALDAHLGSGSPAKLMVPSSGSSSGVHFVVVTGKTTVAGVGTYTINDPVYGKTTLYERYSNNYLAFQLFERTLSSVCAAEMIEISAHSPVHLVVTDPLGRRVGYDPRSKASWDEIPGAGYTVNNNIGATDGSVLPGPKLVHIPGPIDGAYVIQVFGYDTGAFEVDVSKLDSAGVIWQDVFTGTARSGSVDHYTTQYTSKPHIYLPLILRFR
jgi:hypothetical protein